MKKLNLIYHRRGGDVKKTISFLKADAWEGEVKSENGVRLEVNYIIYYAGGNARIEFDRFFQNEEVKERFEDQLNNLLVEGEQRQVNNHNLEIWDLSSSV